MIRVLWCCNVVISADDMSASGTWMQSMLKHIVSREEIEICGIMSLTPREHIETMEVYGIPELLLPIKGIQKDGMPIRDIRDAIDSFILRNNPDIVHIWGVEMFWAGYMGDKHSNIKQLIEIQGLKGVCSEPCYFWGGMSPDEIKCAHGLREYIRPKDSIKRIQKSFEKWGEIENRVIKNAKYINTQSDWVRCVISETASDAKIYKTGIILRESFTDSPIWAERHLEEYDTPALFTVSAPFTYKAVHTLINTVAILKDKLPDIKLRIAGIDDKTVFYKETGYVKFLKRKVKSLGLENNIIFLGRLTEDKLVEEMYRCDVFVYSSYVETYCLALAEALALGCPTVTSYSSALIELAAEGNALTYPAGDSHVCASKIMRLLQDRSFSKKMSRTASYCLRKKSDSDRIVDCQIETYTAIFKDNQL